jgi:hypothetical protein
MRLRQIALVARDLQPVVDDLQAIFGLGTPFADPGVDAFGLCNAVFPIGSTYLEVVSPLAPGTTAGRLLDRRGGDGGYMVIVQTDALERERERVEALGVRVVWEVDLGDAATLHLHPRDVGGAILSLDQMDPPASWRWAGPGWQERSRTDVVTALVAAEIQAEDPVAMATRWADVIGAERRDRELVLEDGRIRFVPLRDDRGEGVSGLDIAVRDRAHVERMARERGVAANDGIVEVAGVRVRLV